MVSDVLFHMVFTNNNTALRGLISSLLNIPDKEMADVIVLNPMQYMEAVNSKLTVLDLRIHIAIATSTAFCLLPSIDAEIAK